MEEDFLPPVDIDDEDLLPPVDIYEEDADEKCSKAQKVNKNEEPRTRSFKRPPCRFEGCHRVANSRKGDYCHGHRYNMVHFCKIEGCGKLQSYASSPPTFCYKHSLHAQSEFEIVRRLKRNSALRSTMLPRVAGDQKNVCASKMKTCEVVDSGEATLRCPFNGRKVPTDMQQLDHIVPYSTSCDDSRQNLQMLCACCHAAKSIQERRDESIRHEQFAQQEKVSKKEQLQVMVLY